MSKENSSGSTVTNNKLASLLHFSVEQLSDNIRQQLGISKGIKGVVVNNVSRNSEAYQKGLRKGDVIMEAGYNGRRYPIKNVKEFNKAMSGVKKGDAVILKVYDPNQDAELFLAFQLY